MSGADNFKIGDEVIYVGLRKDWMGFTGRILELGHLPEDGVCAVRWSGYGIAYPQIKNIRHAFLPYDPKQQGDKNDDI